MRLRPRITGIFLVAAIAVFALLPIPHRGRFATAGLAHQCAHVAAFSLAFLLLCAGSRTARSSITVAVILLIFGIALEIFQTCIYGIALEYSDISANAAGIVLGFLGRSVAALKQRHEG